MHSKHVDGCRVACSLWCLTAVYVEMFCLFIRVFTLKPIDFREALNKIPFKQTCCFKILF